MRRRFESDQYGHSRGMRCCGFRNLGDQRLEVSLVLAVLAGKHDRRSGIWESRETHRLIQDRIHRRDFHLDSKSPGEDLGQRRQR